MKSPNTYFISCLILWYFGTAIAAFWLFVFSWFFGWSYPWIILNTFALYLAINIIEVAKQEAREIYQT